MNFMRNIYFCIGGFILVVGLSCTPFIESLISPESSIPKDVNIYIVYVLFVLKSASTYLYSYKQILLTADQKQYVVSLIECGVNIFRCLGQIIILYVSHKYILTIVADIIITIVLNYICGVVISREYREIFNVKANLKRADRKLIYDDTKANMFHKIGYVVLKGTDNIVLSKFAGLVATGLYSNYSLVITGLDTVFGKILGSFTSSIGNAHIELSSEENYVIYKRLLFANLWLTSVTSICLYSLIDSFVKLWVGKEMVMGEGAVIAICLEYYLMTSRKINTSYTNGTGQFVKDRYRPVLEAVLNVIISIILVKKIGVCGVFFGTIISNLLTVFWREPYILYKYVFNKNLKEYWKLYFTFFSVTILFCSTSKCLAIEVNNWGMLIVNFLVLLVVSNVILCILCLRNNEGKYYISLCKHLILKLRCKLE